MRTRFAAAPALLACLAVALPASAQDTHYWNDQYGPRAMMLSGVVVGSIHDMSATYYNPGALGYVEQPQVLLSANVYRFETLSIQDGAGEGVDLDTSNFSLLPNMLAGAVRKSWLGNNKFAYSVLTRQRNDVEASGTQVGKVDVLDSQGDEDFAGAITLRNKTSDLWIGATWARGGLGRKAGFGITTYFSARSQDRSEEFFAQAKGSDGQFALVFDTESFEYTYYSLLWKAGLGFDLDPVSLGVTLTTPRIGITGSGGGTLNETVTGVDADGDSIPDSQFTTSVQENVSSTYKTPLSIAVGGAYHFGSTKIHLAAEWFDKVDVYEVLELQPFVSQATGETIDPSLTHALESVTNWGFGIEHAISDTFRWYLSFATDLSAFDDRSDLSISPYDLYHVAGGSTFGLGRSKFTLGLAYAWGSEMVEQVFDLNPGEDGSVIDPNNMVDLQYQGLTFILGFEVTI